MEKVKVFPRICPSCQEEMRVETLICPSCQTKVSGSFTLPVLLRLESKEQEFILEFVRSSGSLKQMAQTLGLSYPTVRNMLDDIIAHIEKLEK